MGTEENGVDEAGRSAKPPLMTASAADDVISDAEAKSSASKSGANGSPGASGTSAAKTASASPTSMAHPVQALTRKLPLTLLTP